MMAIEAGMTSRPLPYSAPGFCAALAAAWRAYAAARRQRREIFALSRKSPRVLRDMGFDPQMVYRSCGRIEDELDPAIQRYYRIKK